MKTAIWILSAVVVGLAILAFKQWNTIKKLNNPNGTRMAEGDGAVRFGDMVKAWQTAAKEITITTKL